MTKLVGGGGGGGGKGGGDGELDLNGEKTCFVFDCL